MFLLISQIAFLLKLKSAAKITKNVREVLRMADNNQNKPANKKVWIIAAIVIVVLLAFVSTRKKEEKREVETPAITQQESETRDNGAENRIGDRYDLLLNEDDIEEPGKTAASEGINLYVKEKYEEAKEFLEKAAEEGNADAKALLGKMYVSGHGVVQDMKKGLEYLEDAVERGSSYAMAELGLLYAEGKHGVEKAADKGVELIKRSIEAGKYYGYLAMAKLHLMGEGVEHSVEKAVDYLKQAGEHGYKHAAEEIEKLKEKL